MLFTFVVILILFYFKKQLKSKTAEIQMMLNLYERLILYIEEENKLFKKTYGYDLPYDEKIDMLKKKFKELKKIYSLIINKYDNISSLLVLLYNGEANAKKVLTKEFYTILNKYTRKEQYAYELTYIFNRFLNDLFKNPIQALPALLSRIFIYFKRLTGSEHNK